MRFRRGGFQGLLPVRPIWFKFNHGTVRPDYASLKGLALSLILICEMVINTLETHSYPVFVPNDYLFTVYAKTIPGYEKMEKWEIYAHAVNDFMRKEGQFG